MSDGVGKLKQEVETLEARNEARRDVAPVSDRNQKGRLGKSWSRLEELKTYHDELAAE